ncbi:hypothetical protein GQ53DRAFT_863583 [Thozetella sp. PMI_491]|nr:hypothetical protein GQ53DRAFT_863583 [Thozetella sp. PMI_491]
MSPLYSKFCEGRSALVFFAASRRNVCEAGNSDVKNSLLKATSEPSPLLDLIDISLISKRMNGSLLETNPKNIYRQSPSPEVDAAWGRIQTRDSIVITREDVIRMGKDPEDASKYPEWMGLGSDAYIAKVDVFHQIHCLNTLRKNLHKNYDYYYDKPEDKFQDLHVSHCLVNLLENLMCYGNVDVYTHVWNDAQIHPFADFNINHKCRDFDAILAWQEENAIPLDSWSDARPPDDYKVHVMSHEFKEVLHWYDDHPNVYFEGGETA